jgi:hypothetical protein
MPFVPGLCMNPAIFSDHNTYTHATYLGSLSNRLPVSVNIHYSTTICSDGVQPAA